MKPVTDTRTALLGRDEPHLSPRQAGAVACLMDGLSYSQAAAAMGTTTRRFEEIVRVVRVKFRARTTVQALALAGAMAERSARQ